MSWPSSWITGSSNLHTQGPDPVLDVPDVVDRALEGDGIAQQGGLLVVISPKRSTGRTLLRVEVWPAEPPDDREEWQDCFEAHLRVAADGLTFESPTASIVDLDVPRGAYRALISGRGFDSEPAADGTVPEQHWRIQLSPKQGRHRNPTHLKHWISKDELAYGSVTDALRALTPHLAASAQASMRLRADLDYEPISRSRSRTLGTARTHRTFPNPVGQPFEQLLLLTVWATNRGGSYEPEIGTEFYTLDSLDDRLDVQPPSAAEKGFVATHGYVRGRWTEIEKNQLIALTWNWYVPATPKQPGRAIDQIPYLPSPSKITMTFMRPATSHSPSTEVQIEHADLPIEWVDDMVAVWNRLLERAAIHLGYRPPKSD